MAQRQQVSSPNLWSQTSSANLECGHQQLVIGNHHWPLRLINISATLACEGGIIFTATQDWDFHVISHTWSLSIRQFSKEVGKSVSRSFINDDDVGLAQVDMYSNAFGRADFSAEDGYKDLLKLLKILMEDGVKNVWFDALCINQMDKDEMGREMMHMGAYYRYSTGCYVVIHGIGQGYNLLGFDKNKNEVCLPRWFTRVWTLPEFLLPTKLIFLVSLLRRDVISRVNEQIKQHNAVGFCNCCLWGKWTLYFCKCCKLPYWQCHNRRGAGDDGEEILGSGHNLVMCMNCKVLPLIWKAKGCTDADGQLYFVERSAYQCLVSIHLAGPFIPGQRDVLGTLRVQRRPTPSESSALPHSNLKSWQFFQLYRLLASKCFACDAMLYGALVQSRNCSVKHEEDRVLSILRLLGLEGSMQVRKGQTLEQQWVEVARELLGKVKFLWQPKYASWTPNYENGSWLSILIRLQSLRLQGNGGACSSGSGGVEVERTVTLLIHSPECFSAVHRIACDVPGTGSSLYVVPSWKWTSSTLVGHFTEDTCSMMQCLYMKVAVSNVASPIVITQPSKVYLPYP